MVTVTEIADQKALKQLSEHRNVNDIRDRSIDLCKDFKTHWISLGQVIGTIEEGNLYHAWGYEKLEDYALNELGLNLKMVRKLTKCYSFLIEDTPEYLGDNFKNERTITKIPSLDDVDFLRTAKGKKDLLPEDYAHLKKKIFEEGKVSSELKQDLTTLMKERKVVDVDAEKEKRKNSLINSLIRNLTEFHTDMQSSKLVPFKLIKEAEDLLNKLKEEKESNHC